MVCGHSCGSLATIRCSNSVESALDLAIKANELVEQTMYRSGSRKEDNKTFEGGPLGFPLPDESESQWLLRRMRYRYRQVEELYMAESHWFTDNLERGRTVDRTNTRGVEPTRYDHVSRRVWERSPYRCSRSVTPPADRMEKKRKLQAIEEKQTKIMEEEIEIQRKLEKRRKHIERMARIEAKKRGLDPIKAVEDAVAKFDKEQSELRKAIHRKKSYTVAFDSDGKPQQPASIPTEKSNENLLSSRHHDEDSNYGSDLLAGEGSAIAAYIKSGKRIPRRGEIGLTSDQITSFEDAGFVMSGSRHKLMNAVRKRKENQVITAEEKKALLIQQKQEREQKEKQIVNNLQELVKMRVKSATKKVEREEDEEHE